MNKISLLIGIVLLLLFACSMPTDSQDPGPIVITSVSPDSGLLDNESTDFIVEISYQIEDFNMAQVAVSFNTGNEVDVFHSHTSRIFQPGSGTATFEVTAIAKDWGSEGDFQVLVTALGLPGGEIFGSDEQVLKF